MAGTYTNDLSTLLDADATQAWDEPANGTGWTDMGAATDLGGDTDDFIQGVAAASGQPKAGIGALFADNGSAVTMPENGAFLIWAKFDGAAGLVDKANGGIKVAMGSADNAFSYYNHGGSDTYQKGGWINLANAPQTQLSNSTLTNPTVSEANIGTPTSNTYQFVGWAYEATSVPSKGQSYKVDAIRYGRCTLTATGGDFTAVDHANPLTSSTANFPQLAQYNDYNDATNGYNSFGLFTLVNGAYLHKGRIQLGNTSTSVNFSDLGRSISIDDTEFVTDLFNRYEINNTSSNVRLDSITISSLGDRSPGTFEVVDNANVTIVDCTFRNMDTFTFNGNISGGQPNTLSGVQFNSCNTVFQNNSSITTCEFLDTTDNVALNTNDISNVNTCTFRWNDSGSDNYALEIPNGFTGTFTLQSPRFNDYPTGGNATANAMIYNNSGGAVTLNVDGGLVDGAVGTITWDDGAGASTTINQVVTNFVEVIDVGATAIANAVVAVYDSADDSEVFNGLSNVNGQVEFTSDPGIDIYVRVRKSTTGSTRYIPVETVGATGTNGTSITVTLTVDTIVSA